MDKVQNKESSNIMPSVKTCTEELICSSPLAADTKECATIMSVQWLPSEGTQFNLLTGDRGVVTFQLRHH
jgi:hypothetical protein